MSRMLQRISLKFQRVLRTTGRSTRHARNMKPSRADIVEEIITHLGVPDRPGIRDKVNVYIDTHLKCCAMLRRQDFAAISKLAKRLDDAVAPWMDGMDMPIPLKECDRIGSMQELRSALHWLQQFRAAPRNQVKIDAANTAAALSRELSRRGRGERYEALQAIADLVYQVSSGKQASMKRAVDDVIRWRKPELDY